MSGTRFSQGEGECYRNLVAAVQGAIAEGVMPRDFVKVAGDVWATELRDDADGVEKDFSNMMAPRLIA